MQAPRSENLISANTLPVHTDVPEGDVRELSCLSVGHGLNTIDCYLASNTFQTRMIGLFDVRLQKINDCGCTVNFLGQANLVAFGQMLDSRSDVDGLAEIVESVI